MAYRLKLPEHEAAFFLTYDDCPKCKGAPVAVVASLSEFEQVANVCECTAYCFGKLAAKVTRAWYKANRKSEPLKRERPQKIAKREQPKRKQKEQAAEAMRCDIPPHACGLSRGSKKYDPYIRVAFNLPTMRRSRTAVARSLYELGRDLIRHRPKLTGNPYARGPEFYDGGPTRWGYDAKRAKGAA